MDEREPTREEVDLLHFRGFHEVKGLAGIWQRGRVGVDVPTEPKVYSFEEALRVIKEERGAVEDD